MDYESLQCAVDRVVYDWMEGHGVNPDAPYPAYVQRAVNILLDALECAVAEKED